jgi:hypothetical protein
MSHLISVSCYCNIHTQRPSASETSWCISGISTLCIVCSMSTRTKRPTRYLTQRVTNLASDATGPRMFWKACKQQRNELERPGSDKTNCNSPCHIPILRQLGWGLGYRARNIVQSRATQYGEYKVVKN